MNPDLIEVILFVFGVVVAIVQWFLNNWVANLEKSIDRLHESQEKIDSEIKSIKESYAPRADIKEIKDEIISRLARIENYLMDRQKNV